jgi:methionyl-tRNA formyltransferase
MACYGCLNIHPSLLPKYRGTAPVVNAILSGDDFAGVSVMRLDAGMDSGPVFSRAQVPILAQDTAETLTPRLFQIGAWMLLDVMSALSSGKEIPEPQDSSLATFTREVVKEDGRIDWKAPVVKIWRQVRAYQPWPAAYTFWQGKQLKIIEAIPLAAVVNPEPGRVVALLPTQTASQAAFGVGAGEGVLGVLKVQLEGKRAMSADEFLRGQKEFIGGMLG